MPTEPSAGSTHCELHGTPVVPGVAYAPALVVHTEVPQEAIAAFQRRELTEQAALDAYDGAVNAVAGRLSGRADSASGPAAEVLAATAGLARDSGLRGAVGSRLANGDGLIAGVSAAIGQFVTTFEQLGGVMAERTTDLRDIERRVIAELVGVPEPGVPVPEHPVVLIADDLAPADTAALHAEVIAALVTEHGSPIGHTAIIARQLGIPCVVAVSGVMSLAEGTSLLVDGSAGTITAGPDRDVAARKVDEADRRRRALAEWTGPGQTSDGHRVRLLANVQDGETARVAAEAEVEGVGLFRTELCFLDRSEEPSVGEQAAIYAEVLRAFGPLRRVLIRTLDAGSDKPIGYATRPHEPNPALGVRGIRLSSDNPGLLYRQLEAIAVAAAETETAPQVMAPMVATVAEARTFAEKVRELGLEAGAMIEIPSAALLARQLLDELDFVSIGTNDLTQYTMAADRMAGDLAELTDPWQPAVLALVAATAEAGTRVGKPVGVCGEAATDPRLAAVLVGMGITSLSMAPVAVPAVGVELAALTLSQCEQSAVAALAQSDPVAARSAVRALIG